MVRPLREDHAAGVDSMRHLRTDTLGVFPLSAALSLLILAPCAAVLQRVGEVTSPGVALATGAVGVGGAHALITLTAWACAFTAERAVMLLGYAASFRPDETATSRDSVRT